MRLDILLGIIAVLMAILGGFVSVWPPRTGKGRALYASFFLLFGIASIVLIVRQSNDTAKAQREIQEKADRQEKELRGKLDQSLMSQEYMRGQLETIGLMIGKVGEAKNDADMKKLATVIVKVTKDIAWNRPYIVSITAPNGGNFQVNHKLSCLPGNAVIQMTSPGLIRWQAPNKMFDKTSLYLDASDEGLTGIVLVWCEP